MTIDTVFSFSPGDNTEFGQGAEFFPENIFGMPAPGARKDVPAATPEEVVALGFEGVIIVGMRSFGVRDAAGPDFVIFENAFEFGLDRIYAEPARVAVSQFGEEWHEFPCDAASLDGCAGTSPSTGDYDPFDDQRSGGNAFDLADLDLDWVRYIRIEDVSRAVRDDSNHEFYDPTINGFELDALVIQNPMSLSTDVAAAGVQPGSALEPVITFRQDQIELKGLPGSARLEVYNLNGILLKSQPVGAGSVVLNLNLERGTYACVLRDRSGVLARELFLCY